MIKLRFAVLLFSFSLLVGCTGSTTVVTSDYKGQMLSAQRLAVVPFTPTILNKDDVVDDLGAGVADDTFLKYFRMNFPPEVQRYSRIASVGFLRERPTAALTDKELAISDEERIKVALPADGTTLSPDSLKPDFVLFLSQYVVSRIAGSNGTWTPGLPGTPGTFSGGSFGKLQHQAEFALWDNTKGRLVSYGRVISESSIIFGMMITNWNSCVSSMAQQIMKASPLYEFKRMK